MNQLTTSYKKHVRHITLKDPTILIECAILKELPNGDLFYFTIESLDLVDRKRLVNILSRPDSHTRDLCDVLQQVTLNNGANALEYFHQLAYVKTKGGGIMKPAVGRSGASMVQVSEAPKLNSVVEPTTDTTPTPSGNVTTTSPTPATQTDAVSAPVKKAPFGRHKPKA